MFQRFFTTRFHTGSMLRATLLSAALLDEILTGITVIGLPLLREQLGLSYTQVGLIFTVGAGVAMVIEPIANLWSERGSKRFWILGGLLIIVLGDVLAGFAPNFSFLLLAFMLSGPASGIAIGLAQAAIIDYNPHEATRAMTRWTLLAGIGDLLSPLIITFIVSLNVRWTGLCLFSAAVWLVLASILAFQRFPRPVSATGEPVTPPTRLLDSLSVALRNPTLLRWALLSLIPTMVDEIFLSFATLYLHDVLHASTTTIGLIMTTSMCISLGMLFALERFGPFKKIAPRYLLAGLAVPVLLGMTGLLFAHNLWLVAASLLMISLGAAGWYPLAKGQAYAQLPGRSGTVRAICSSGDPLFEVALPGIVGQIAGRFGLRAGLGLLALAPVFVLLLTLLQSPTTCSTKGE